MNQSSVAADRETTSLEPRRALILALCAFVVLFRIAAWRSPSNFVEIPEFAALPLMGLGLVHLTCGIWAWTARPSHLTRVFLISSLGGAMHWGGSIGAENSGLETAFVTLYLAATALGDAAFLDLALRYPRDYGRHGVRTVWFYLVGLLTLVAVPITPFLPKNITASLLGLVLGLAFAMSIAGGLVFVWKWVRASSMERRRASLSMIVAALIVSTVLDLIADAGALPGEPDLWSLVYVFPPIALAWALVRYPLRE